MKRTDDDTEFMEELEAATRLKPTFTSGLMLFSVTGFALFFIAWAGLSQIEEITRGSGQVVPSSEIQVVQSLEGGILGEILVSEGERVSKGQVLLRISDVAFSSEERGAEYQSYALKAKKARLEAEAKGTAYTPPAEILKDAPDIARNEEDLFRSRQEEVENRRSILNDKITRAQSELGELKAKISRLSDSRALLQKEYNITREMVAKRAVPQLEEIRLQRELNDISGQIRESEQRSSALNADLSSATKERADVENKFKSQALGELNDVQTQLRQIDESLAAIGDRVFRTEVRSPVDGVVNKIALKTIGGVIEPAMKLVEIVPVDDELKVVARVSPEEIAFLRPDQDVKVKITAYDPQRYGSLDGKLTRIGANSVTDREGNAFFEIEVSTEKNYLGTAEAPLPITPGMVAQTEVITGKKSILAYLMKPVLRAKDRALTER